MLKISELSVNGVRCPAFLPCEGLRVSWVLTGAMCVRRPAGSGWNPVCARYGIPACWRMRSRLLSLCR